MYCFDLVYSARLPPMATEMIQKRMKIIEELTQELNKLKEHYNETLENDAGYQQIVEETKKIREESKVKQEKLLTNSSYKAIADKIKEARQSLKENKEVLSQELIEYYKDNGTLEIEDPEGNVKRMKFSVRLVN